MGYALAGACKLPVEDLEPGAGEIRELYRFFKQEADYPDDQAAALLVLAAVLRDRWTSVEVERGASGGAADSAS